MQNRRWRGIGAVVAIGTLLLAAGCGKESDSGSPAADPDASIASAAESETVAEPAESPVATEPADEVVDDPADDAEDADQVECPDTLNWDTAEESAELSIGGMIDGLSSGNTECFDSVSVRINPSDVEPGFVVKYVDEVLQPGSGFPVPVAGSAALEVTIDSPAYDVNTGEETFHHADPDNVLEPSWFEVIEQFAFAGSFEGMTTFAVGVTEELPFIVETSIGSDDYRYVTITIAHSSDGSASSVYSANESTLNPDPTCDDVDTWTAAAESSELSGSGAIFGVGLMPADCFEEFSIMIEQSENPPGFDVGYIDVVTEDGSGFEVPVAGGAALQVVVDSPIYDSDTGDPTFVINDPEHVLDVDGLEAIQQVAFAGSFEGMTRFAIGLPDERPFSVESGTDAYGDHVLLIRIAIQ